MMKRRDLLAAAAAGSLGVPTWVGAQAGNWPQRGPVKLIMIPDPAAARRHVAPGLRILFTGGRAMRDPAECTAFNAGRYRWVKKRIERTETVMRAPGADRAEGDVVYSLGTLYGEWPDGTPFEGNRYVDRYVVKDGLITDMQVWNDSAEWLLVRAGLATL